MVNDSLADEFLLIKTIEKVRASDKQFHNIRSLNSRYGRANWDLSFVIKQKNGLKTLLIPFSKNNATTALLIAYQENARLTKFKLIDRKTRQTNFPKEAVPDPTRITPETMKNLFIASDKALEVSKQYKEERLQKNQVITITYTCTMTTWSYLPPNSNEVVVGASYPQCTFTITEGGAPYEGFAPPDEAQWNYIETESPNQIIIDSLNGYPCAQSILGQLPAVGTSLSIFLDSVFNTADDIDVYFRPKLDFTKDSIDGFVASIGSAGSFINFPININPWVMQNSSKEYIAATLIHEAIHGYINVVYYRYKHNWTGYDSNYVKTHLGIFWDFLEHQGTTNPTAQHNEMAVNYVAKMKEFLIGFCPGIDDAMATALAWGGLRDSNVWKAKSTTDQNIILDLNHIARRDSSGTNVAYSNYGLNKCP